MTDTVGVNTDEHLNAANHVARRIVNADHSTMFAAEVHRLAMALKVKYWGIIADNLHDAGWSLGWVSAVDLEGRTIWIVDAHRYGKRFVVDADEMLGAFVELQRAVCIRLLTEQVATRS